MYTGSIAAFFIFFIVTQLMLGGDRPFPASGEEGFKIVYHKDLKFSDVRFFIDSSKNPTNIVFVAVVDVDRRKDYATIALEIPYTGIVKHSSGWNWFRGEDSTLFVKEFSCTPQLPCSFEDEIQHIEFELEEVIDQKHSFRHSVRLWFPEIQEDTYNDVTSLFKKYDPDRKPYYNDFEEIDNAVATVILDQSANTFGLTPNAPILQGPLPKTIHIDWVIEGEILHQIDYQLPEERKQEDQMLYYTALFGIGLGIAHLTVFGMEMRKRKLERDLK